MPEARPGAAIELPARPYHHGEREQGEADLQPPRVECEPSAQHGVEPRGEGHEQPSQHVDRLEGGVRLLRHQQHRAQHRDDGHRGGEREFPRQALDLALPRDPLALERVLGGNRLRHVKARPGDGLLQRFRRRRAGNVVHGDRFGRLVRRRAHHARHATERLLEGRDPGRIVQLLDAERDACLATVVAGRAHRLDQVGHAGLRVVIVDGRLRRRVVDRGHGDPGGAGQSLLHRGGTGRAAHSLDRQHDP